MRRLLLLAVLLGSSFALSLDGEFGVRYSYDIEQRDMSDAQLFFYLTHDWFLFEIESLDTQLWFSPSVEVFLPDEFLINAQFLVDAPPATLSLRMVYDSARSSLSFIAGVLFGF